MAVEPNLSNIQTDIESQISSVALTDIRAYGLCIECDFESELSPTQQTTLKSIVVNNDSLIFNEKMLTSLVPKIGKFNTTTYSRVVTFTYEGYEKGLKLSSFRFVSHMDSGVNYYIMRIFDITNGNVIATAQFNNTIEEMQIIYSSSITNLPERSAVIEVQISVNGGNSSKNVFIDSVSVFGD